MARITYENKVALNENPAIADINKVKDDDMNEIKNSVNSIYEAGLIEVGEEEPKEEDAKIWVDTDEEGEAMAQEIQVSASEPVDGTKMWVQYSDNLLDFSKFEASKTLNGITFTNNNDGTITLNGTATATTGYALLGNENNQYTLEGNYINGGINENVYMMVINRSVSGYTVIARTTNDKPTLINKSTYTTGYIELRVNAGATVNNVVVKPMLTYDAQEKFIPYVKSTNIKINNNGKYETIVNKNMYALSETVIGELLGKPLYRLLIETTLPNAATNGTFVNKTISLAQYNMDKKYKFIEFGNVSKLLSGQVYNLPINTAAPDNANYRTVVSFFGDNLEIRNSFTIINDASVELSLVYTKTTD